MSARRVISSEVELEVRWKTRDEGGGEVKGGTGPHIQEERKYRDEKGGYPWRIRETGNNKNRTIARVERLFLLISPSKKNGGLAIYLLSTALQLSLSMALLAKLFAC